MIKRYEREEKQMNKLEILKLVGKIGGKVIGTIGLLGLSAMGIKVANDVANSAYKDCKQSITQNGRAIKNELCQDEDDE